MNKWEWVYENRGWAALAVAAVFIFLGITILAGFGYGLLSVGIIFFLAAIAYGISQLD